MKKLADLFISKFKKYRHCHGKSERDIHTYIQLILVYIYYTYKQTNLLQHLTAIILIPTVSYNNMYNIYLFVLLVIVSLSLSSFTILYCTFIQRIDVVEYNLVSY